MKPIRLTDHNHSACEFFVKEKSGLASAVEISQSSYTGHW